MGFPLQNRGAHFSPDRKSPSALAGHKRSFHTIIPAFMEHGDQHIGFGIMGGMNQPLAHAEFVSNVVDYHMNIQAAMGRGQAVLHDSTRNVNFGASEPRADGAAIPETNNLHQIVQRRTRAIGWPAFEINQSGDRIYPFTGVRGILPAGVGSLGWSSLAFRPAGEQLNLLQ
jgi:gamma-glutamyltranspeptidase